MKQTVIILTFLVLSSCVQLNSREKITTVSDSVSTDLDNNEYKHRQENYQKQSLRGFKKATLYNLTESITADFNGDGIIDKAFYIKENGTSGIIIKHGNTGQEFRIGFGDNFSVWTDGFDCNWVDYWGLVEDKETTETTFTKDGDVLGTKEVELQNPSIVIGEDEIGGGLITYLKGKYVWIHQSC